MSFLRSTFGAGLCTGLLCLSLAANATDFTGFLYVSDYKAAELDRYSYTYNSTTNTIGAFTPAGAGGSTTSAVFITGGIKEGLQGTNNDIIIVNSGGSTLSRYDLNGNLIGTIAVKNADNTAHSFSNIGNVIITPDGKYLYAPESSGNVIDKVDLATGVIVAHTAFNGAHDLAIAADGSVYAAAYQGSNAGSAGVWVLSSDLSTKTQLIASGDNGLTSPSGMSIASDGSLYVQQNQGSGPDGVYHYKISGSGSSAVATFDPLTSLTSSAALHFTFGNNIGPDGNLYIAALGGASGRSGNSGYTDGVYQFNTTSLAVTRVIDGGVNSGVPGGPSGLESPKYLQFGTNFVQADDPGAPGTPEPGSLALLFGMGVTGAGCFVRRRRKPRDAA
jgi:hypothetical protein